MPRLCASFLILITSTSLIAQEPDPTPPEETEETVVVENTGGERDDAQQPDLEPVVQQIVERTNAFRKEQDRKPLKTSDKLTKAAQQFADYMARTGRYGHLADERTPDARAEAAGYEYCIVSENIAYAFRSDGFSTQQLVDRFVNGWKESPGHRKNMLARHIVETGVALAKSEETDTYFAVQLFGRPRSMAIAFEVVNKSDLTVSYQLGEQTASLPPQVVRTHQGCTPQVLKFQPLEQTTESSKPATFNANGGERFIVEPADTGYKVTIDEIEEPLEGEVPSPNEVR